MVSATFEAVYHTWCECRRRKRETPKTQYYEINLLSNLMETVQALREKNWQPSPAVCFVMSQPKGREIHAARATNKPRLASADLLSCVNRVVVGEKGYLPGGLKRRCY